MKKISLFLWITIMITITVVGSSSGQIGMLGAGEEAREGMLSGGIGLTKVDDQTYFTLSLHPEISFGKFGLGLNIDLLYDTKTGGIRTKDWDESYDYFRMIRYIRYGWKGEEFYTKVGTLDGARLGHGFIMNYYTNEADWDERKLGLEFDLDFGSFGFESVTSNLGRMEIIGGRAYVRPLQQLITVPVIKNITFGATFVTDTDPDENRNSKDKVSVYGGDVELPVIDTRIIWTGLYADYAKISDYGSGKAVGIGFQFKNLFGVLHVETRFERRWLGTEFLPSFFDAFYEIDRFLPISPQGGIRKEDQLLFITEKTKGYFGEVYGRILGSVHIIGNFQRIDDVPKSGILHLSASAQKLLPGIALQASYDKRNIETFKDVRTLDNRSVARVSVGYKIKPYLTLFMDYIWSFVLDENSNRYLPQERYQPRLAFNYNFSL